MTETEWLRCGKPWELLAHLGKALGDSKAARRKARLLLAGFCRCVWGRIEDPRSRALVEASEQYADASIGYGGLKGLWDAHRKEVGRGSWGSRLAWDATHRDVWQATRETWAMLSVSGGKETPVPAMKDPAIVGLIREVFGNPFRPVSVDRAWLSPTVVSLATIAYDQRELPSGHLDTSRLAVLSDALEEAGCTDPEILEHLRSPGPHVRGCHVIDQLLGKK